MVSFKAEMKRTLESDGDLKRRGRGKLKWNRWSLQKEKQSYCWLKSSTDWTGAQCLIIKSTIQSGWLLAATSLAYLRILSVKIQWIDAERQGAERGKTRSTATKILKKKLVEFINCLKGSYLTRPYTSPSTLRYEWRLRTSWKSSVKHKESQEEHRLDTNLDRDGQYSVWRTEPLLFSIFSVTRLHILNASFAFQQTWVECESWEIWLGSQCMRDTTLDTLPLSEQSKITMKLNECHVYRTNGGSGKPDLLQNRFRSN